MNINNTSNFSIHTAKNVGPVIQILQLNIEGISISKSECISKVARDHSIDIIALQKTHTISDSDIQVRGEIAGFALVAHIPNRVYGIETYVRNTITNYHIVSESTNNNVFSIAVEICGITVVNVYKPPNVIWMDSPITSQTGPTVYIGDFNSHHTSWGYTNDNRNGDLLCTWADTNQLHLLYDAKDRGTFHSARWRRDYNPDFCFVSSNGQSQPLRLQDQCLKTSQTASIGR